MLPYECTPYPWLVRIMYVDGEPMFSIYEHTRAQIVADREFWPECRRPNEVEEYFPLDEHAFIMPNRVGVARLIVSAPTMYELLKETLEWLDDKFPADKYPLDLDNHYRNRCDIAVARRRESIRSIISECLT